MDELDLLKKDWNKGNNNYPKLSYNDIYKMILKKSSSIVKWIFIISLLEFGFWLSISFAFKGSVYANKIDELNINHILIPITVISYAVLIYFFYLFYKNYKNISTTDSSKTLMENILKTRRTVKQYVIFNLASLFIGAFIGVFYNFNHNPEFSSQLELASANGEVFKFYAVIFMVTLVVIGIVIGVLLLFYWLIYGILLKRLNHNYKELKKLES
ncbi:hypothetical protein [Algibacter pectinivorans]|uniref:Uncharacterized protein n=1 Tax=Algibacter pectinivorans TaxID=870482 RepID=A0A1I1QJI7_9FLAO|nr:hypothetical protein [Algibacter pectinivorans]SFD20008.1 hypothetical protein SAMN04487987_10645 [Algibacter pectinivorans]